MNVGAIVTTKPTGFRDWLRAQMEAHGCRTPSGRYLIREFHTILLANVSDEEQAEIPDEVSLSRYIREDNPIATPKPETCRALAHGLGIKPVEVLRVVGYIQDSDF